MESERATAQNKHRVLGARCRKKIAPRVLIARSWHDNCRALSPRDKDEGHDIFLSLSAPPYSYVRSRSGRRRLLLAPGRV